MSDEVKKTLSQLKAEAVALAHKAIEWAEGKHPNDQRAAQAQLAAAQRMPEDPPEAAKAEKETEHDTH